MTDRPRGFKLRRFPPVQLLLYAVLRAVLMIVNMFPYSMAPQVGRWVGRVVHAIDRRHRRVAAKNLGKSRGVCPPDAIPEFIERVYAHLGQLFVEMMMIPRMIDRIGDHVRLQGFHVVREVQRRGNGLIVVIGHLGNWEIGGLAVCRSGIALNSLARPIENPWVERYLTRFRTLTGQKLIYKYRALGEMIRVIKKNEVLVIQIDQDAKSSGIYVDFFGHPASTQRSPALLSLKYGTPIVIVNVYRERSLHTCVMSEPIDPGPFRSQADPVRALTQAFTLKFEEFVRAHPEQWFWIHDRWKTAERQPEETPVLAP